MQIRGRGHGLFKVTALLCGFLIQPVAVFADDDTDVKIVRDEYGVPHVFADSAYALWYGAGYAQAEDRLWQADLMRRTAGGRMAELMGPGSIEGDTFARIYFGPDSKRSEMLANVNEATRVQYNAFSDGVNAWIQKAQNEGMLPIEYVAQGLTPAPWRPEDSVAVVQLIFGQFGQSDGLEEFENAEVYGELLAKHGPIAGNAIFADTHWLNDGDSVTTISSTQDESSPPATMPSDDEGHHSKKAGKKWKNLHKGWHDNMEKLGVKGRGASNAIVVGPEYSADGKPLLLGGPQMGYSVPQISVESSLHYGDLNVNGISFPGLPGVAIGVTRDFAWSFTSGMSDTTDIYVDPATSLQCQAEVINVRGSDPVVVPLCSNHHGNAVAQADGVAYVLKRSGYGLELQSAEALQEMQTAEGIEGVDAAMSRWVPNFNMLYADRKGNIAYWHLGLIPIKSPNDKYWFPRPGDGQHEWQGFVAWEDMPHVKNPAQGWIVNWNNRPSADWTNSVNGLGSWGPVHRVSVLSELMKKQQPHSMTVETLADINRLAGLTTQTPSNASRVVPVATLLAPMLTRIATSDDPVILGVLGLLANWNGLQFDLNFDGRYDDPSIAIFNQWITRFTENVFKDELGDTLFEMSLVSNLSWRLLNESPANPLLYDYTGGIPVGDLLLSSLYETIGALTSQHASSSPADWLQAAAYIEWTQLGAVVVPQIPWVNRGTYNQIVHLGRRDELYGMNVVAPGQSGNPYSPHFADQLELYATWQYKPMHFSRRAIRENATSVVRLQTGNADD
ncbi:MAG: penicillin acylase family protein [Gammaproteobacteria bacterium]|nr:penicillin acylase family protein [Gammaproteobacteria bacterium]